MHLHCVTLCVANSYLGTALMQNDGTSNLKLFIWFWGIQGLGVRPIRASVAARCGLVSSGKVLAYQRQLDSYWLKFWRLGLSKKVKWSLCHSFSLKQLHFALHLPLNPTFQALWGIFDRKSQEIVKVLTFYR